MNISELIGLNSTENELKQLIEEKKEPKVLLQGPEGRGKTTILNNISKQLSTKSFCCLHLYGDESRLNEPFYPFKQFVERKEKTFSKGVTVFKESVGSIPYLGKTIKALINDYDFKGKRNHRTIEGVHPFSTHQDFSIHLIGLRRKYPKVLIICDDFDLYDQATVRYLTDLAQGFRILGDEPRVQLIFVVKSLNFETTHLGAFRALQLPPLTTAQIHTLLKEWSGKALPDELIELVVSSSGSHLQLLKLIANHIKEAGSLAGADSPLQFYLELIDARLQGLKYQYEHFRKLLLAVFNAGRRTTTLELVCLLGEEDSVKDLVRKAVQMDFLQIHDNYIQFSHPIIEAYVQSLQKAKPSFLNQLTVCLKKISPSDYRRRAAVQFAAEHQEEADVLWALAAVAKMRQGAFNETDTLITSMQSNHLGRSIREALRQFEHCYRLSFSGDIDKTLLEVERISNALPKELLAEKVYLKSELLLKRIAKAPKQDALHLIEEWEDIKNEEPEIWYRLIQTKIILACELGRHQLALQAETAIVKFFSARISFDPNARLVLERLNLFSEVLYTPEVAHRKMLQAEHYFTNELLNEQFSRVVDLYIARSNLSSNCLVIDEKEKAIEFAKSALDLVEEYKEINFPYPEVPISNLCLTLWWTDANSLASVLPTYKKVWIASADQENRLLVEINYAGFLCINGEYSNALEVLSKTSYLPSSAVDDAYYFYYYWSNFILVDFLNGNQTLRSEKLEELRQAAEIISPFLSKYYLRHCELLRDVLSLNTISSLQDVREYFAAVAETFSSRLWKRFQYGYLLTDLQIWTSS